MTQRKVLIGTVMLMAALGLTGCAKNASVPATNESHVRSARVAKSNSHKVARHDSSSSSQASSQASTSSTVAASSSYSAAATTQQSSANQVSQNTQSSSINQPVASQPVRQQAAASSHSEQHVQLGLGDVAVWTENGVTHHVDSDGMDRQTVNGSSTIHYSDWSGELPQGVQVEHH